MSVAVLLVSCQRQDASDVRAVEPVERALEQLEQASVRSGGNELSGEWIEGDVVRVCDGYLTRREDEDFCEPEIPEEWTPFEYNGQIYYRQPLSGDNDQTAIVHRKLTSIQ